MQFKTITVSESIETFHALGLRKWRKIEASIELNNGDSEDEAYLKASEKVLQWHKQSGAVVEINYEALKEVPIIQLSPKEKTVESMKNDILNAKDMVDLFTFKKIANSDDELKEAYQTRLKQLQ